MAGYFSGPCYGAGRQTLVRILNVTVEPVELRRGTVLGHFLTGVAVVEQVNQYDVTQMEDEEGQLNQLIKDLGLLERGLNVKELI